MKLTQMIILRSKPIVHLLMGLCLGIALSLVVAPFFEDQCVMVFSLDGHENDGLDRINNDDDDFEPEIKTLPPTKDDEDEKQEQRTKQSRIVRPRFLSTELGIKEKLFISVFTDVQSIETRGVAVNKTMNHLVQKLTFFMNGRYSGHLPGLPIVSFTNNRSHMVPFHTIRYIADHYINSFDWFYFFPDSTYIRGERLMDFVQHVSVAQNLMIGKPSNGWENDDTLPCDLDAGVLLSQNVVLLITKNLDWCIRNAIPDVSDTDNLRTCLMHVASALNISCIDRINELHYNYHTSASLDFSLSNSTKSQISLLGKSIAISRLTKEEDFYRLHRLLCEHEKTLAKEELEKFKQEIIDIAPLTPEKNDSLVWPIGVDPPSRPVSRFDLIRWDYFTETHIFFDNDFSNIREIKGVNKQDIQDIVQTAVDRLNLKYENRFFKRRLINGYRRFDAARGMEYTLDLILTDRISAKEIFKRVHLLRPLGEVEIIPMPYVTENTRVNLLLTVFPGEKDGVLSFFDSYAHTCLESGDNTYLFVVFVYESENEERDDIYAVIKSTIAFYENRHRSGARITWMSLQSRGAIGFGVSFMVLDALSNRIVPESLVLRCTVGMDLSIEFLNRVRMNTIKGWQVFFPIGYWSYKPNLVYDQRPYPTTIEINQKSGRYDVHQFVHASFYMDDYQYARRQVSSTGTNVDTLDLYDMFVQYHSLHVFRAVEPALRLQFRIHKCDGLIGRAQNDCLNSRLHSLASRSQLGMLIFEYQQKLDQMQLNVMHQQHGENVVQMKPEMLRKK